MGLARSCKSEGLVQYYRVQKRDGTMQLKNRKCDSNAGSGLGSGLKIQECGELNRQTWSPGHQKRVKTTIKRYTMRSNAQRVMEQKTSLI